MKRCVLAYGLGGLMALGLGWVEPAGPRTAPTPEAAEAELLAPRSGLTRALIYFHRPAGSLEALDALAGDQAGLLQRMRADAARSRAAFLAERATVLTGRNVRPLWIANGLAMDVAPDELDDIRSHPDVRAVELDQVVTLDDPPLAPPTPEDRGDGDTAESTWGLKAIRALEARAEHGVDGSGVLVGILDTGYDADHPDLAGKLVAFKDVVQGQARPYDDNGHGTHCAGTIGGGATSGREIGVAPGVRFVAGKIFTRYGSSTLALILEGMQWVVDPDGKPGTGDEPRLVSNSWGGPPGTLGFREATKAWTRLGIFPVFAAGNAGPREGSVGCPGCYPESFTVGATTVDTTVAVFSSRGPSIVDGVRLIKPDVAAPGLNVYSAWPGGGYNTISGTSMATPHVAGVVALLLQADPRLEDGDLRVALEGSAIQHGDGDKNIHWGSGLIDARAAVELVKPPGE